MFSLRSEAVWRLGSGALFAALMLASAFANHGITPVFGAARVPKAVSRPLDRAAELLARAPRPYDQVMFCDGPKAYVPDRVQLGMGGADLATGPSRPVILCPPHGLDFPAAMARARQDHLIWVRQLADADLIAFAANETSFRAAMAQAGLAIPASDLHPFSPLMQDIRSNLPGAARGADGWLLPAHPEGGTLLFGPYVDLPAGVYRLHVQARLRGSPEQCRAALSGLRLTMTVTADAGKTALVPAAPLPIAAAPGDACAFDMERVFPLPAGGAKAVETPISGAPALPILVSGYTLEPVESAQAR